MYNIKLFEKDAHHRLSISPVLKKSLKITFVSNKDKILFTEETKPIINT